jgi:lysophospholipase L1-like esterase
MGSIADHMNAFLSGSGSLADREVSFWADPTNRNSPVGNYVPQGWGQWWKAALATSRSAPAVVAGAGDSIMRGYFAAAALSNGWFGQLRSVLQTKYGDGGSGFQGVVDALVQSAVMTNYVAEQVVTSVAGGAWVAGATFDGPGSTVIYNNAPGATATFSNVRGTTIRIFVLRAGVGATFSYTIDGGAPVNTTSNGANAILVITVNGLSAGNHTVVLTHTDTAAAYLNVLGVSGENAVGVRLDNYGRQGATSAYLNPGAVTYGQPGDWTGGPSNPADLVIYSDILNDANTNITAANYITNVEAFLSRVKSGTGGKRGKVDILILVPHLGSWGTTKLYSDYLAGLRPLAEAYGAAIVNVWAQGLNSYSRWSDLGYWSDGTSSGTAGADLVHPRTQGHVALFNAVSGLVNV